MASSQTDCTALGREFLASTGAVSGVAAGVSADVSARESPIAEKFKGLHEIPRNHRVIVGKPKDQKVWLKADDEITSIIEKLGKLRFTLE
ncbi:hypothetical protein [Undibacterium sp.]|uniref:hypothetical protein n=1 Tax=Undibacterium sp. TaxID=1914977 RepID=UPI002BC5E825|nr:hypothetical protein [Undibacterium sp.]HTD03994.1 hypothetical protein [Undibacterium sp.]